MDSSVIIAIVAVSISGLSLLLSAVALGYAHRADHRAEEEAERDSGRVITFSRRLDSLI